MYLKSKVFQASNAKLKKRIFIRPQIQSLLADEHFEGLVNPLEKSAGQCFKSLCCNFLGNHKAEKFHDTVADLLHSYIVMGHNMSLIIHFSVSDEHGMHFYQHISTMEKRKQGKFQYAGWLLLDQEERHLSYKIYSKITIYHFLGKSEWVVIILI